MMLVVPAFEAPSQQALPKTKLQALRMLQEKKISPFHAGHFPQVSKSMNVSWIERVL